MFTLLADWRSETGDGLDETERMLAAHRRYAKYLNDNRNRFPESAFSYASACWRNDFSDHRAPHDSWVSEVRFIDLSLPASGGDRKTTIEIVLLGAYHDGHLHLRYTDVHEFQLCSKRVSSGPIEIYRDEVRLTEAGLVLHEIEFLARENWFVECSDIEWEWRPMSL